MPPRRLSNSFDTFGAGPYSPLQDLERRLTEASFHPEDLASILNMANNTVDHRRNVEGTQPSSSQQVAGTAPSTPHEEEFVQFRKGPARWSARWHRGSKAAAQPSNRAKFRRSRAPTLPVLPRFPSLPDFEEGTCGDQRLSRLFSLNVDPREGKSLPELPPMDGDDNNTIRTPHNRGNADQSTSSNQRDRSRTNKGKRVPNIAGGGGSSSTVRQAGNDPCQPSWLIKRNGPRRVVTEKPINDTDRSDSATVQGRGKFVPPPGNRSVSVPTVPRITVGSLSALRPSPHLNIPWKPLPIDRCRSLGCPIKHIHAKGLYLHEDQLSQWKHPYWGISNPPPHIWQAWDRRTDKIATPQEVGDIIGFMENHSYGPHGKVKERATPDDYEVARKERGETWAGGFF